MVNPIGAGLQPVQPVGAPTPGTTTIPGTGIPPAFLRGAGVPPFAPPGTGASGLGPTPAIIQETGAASTVVSVVTLPTGQWVAVDVDRPTILYPIEAEGASPSLGPTLWYGFGQVPVTGLQKSDRGVAFLSGPGRWYVLSQGMTVSCYVIDAWSPGVQMKYLTQPGCNSCYQLAQAVTSSTVVVTLSPARRTRLALTIQNVSNAAGSSGVVRVAMSREPAYLVSGGVYQGNGFRLALGASMTFAGDTLSRGNVIACLDAGSPGPAQVEVLEYYGQGP